MHLKDETGQVGACLLLIIQISLSLSFYGVIRVYLREYHRAYTWLAERQQGQLDRAPEEENIWGEVWPHLPPRIDYGAYTQREKDAEALCYFVRSEPWLAIASDLRCS